MPERVGHREAKISCELALGLPKELAPAASEDMPKR